MPPGADVTSCVRSGFRRHTLSRRRIIPLPQWKANPETDPEALFSKDQLVLALYPQTTCFYRALIHAPPHRVSAARFMTRTSQLLELSLLFAEGSNSQLEFDP